MPNKYFLFPGIDYINSNTLKKKKFHEYKHQQFTDLNTSAATVSAYIYIS